MKRDEAEMHETNRRSDATLADLNSQIAAYEEQKRRLRQQIAELGSENGGNTLKTGEHQNGELIQWRARTADVDKALMARNDEINALEHELATLHKENSDNNNGDDAKSQASDVELAELDTKITDRQTVLKQLLEEATRLGIKLKPGVWV